MRFCIILISVLLQILYMLYDTLVYAQTYIRCICIYFVCPFHTSLSVVYEDID